MVRTSLRRACIAGGISLLAMNAALAQEQDAVVLDTITIYGDRTTTRLDETTSSVAVLDSEALDDATIASYHDAFRHIANVQSGDFTESGFVIRGINSEGQTPGGLGTPLAAYYIDGVQQTVEGTRRGARSLFDAEQFEVYRGPQSTLSGRAALAGAIYLRTTDPEFERSGKAQLTFGENNCKSLGLAFGDHLGTNLAYRISGEYYEKDSDLKYPSYKRFDRYDDLVTDEYYTLRGKLLWLPTHDERTKVLFSYSHAYDSPTPNDIAGPFWSSTSPGYGGRRGDVWGSILPDFYAGFGLTEFPAYQDVRDTKVDSFGIEVTHEINDSLTLTAQTGWSRSVTGRHSVNEGTAGEFLTVDGEFDQKLITQEFRLNYESDQLRWVGGLYFSKEDQGAFRDATLPNSATFAIENQYSRNSAELKNIALFGEVAWEFNPGWTVIAGGRVDRFDQEQSASLAINGVPSTSTTSSFEDTVFIPKIGLQYEITPDQTVSLVYQWGYRPGGSGIKAADGSVFTYDAERAKTIELSYRGRFLDRTSVAANLFYQDWRNQQVEVGSYPDNVVSNAGRSHSYGAEIELSHEVNDRLDLYGSVGLLQTKFRDFSYGALNFEGLSFPNAPKSMVVLGYRWGEDTGWFSNGNVKYVGSSNSRLENGVATPPKLDSYATVDVSVGYGWDDFKLTAYATNLFDEEYFTYENGPGVMATLGARREIGLQLDYTF